MTTVERLSKEYLEYINKDAKKPRKVTEDELMNWVGNSGYRDKQISWLERCLEDGDEPSDIRQEIIDYNEE